MFEIVGGVTERWQLILGSRLGVDERRQLPHCFFMPARL